MNKIKQTFKQIWNDESGQGATEYILLLVIVVAIAILFKDKIVAIIQQKVDDVGGKIQGFTG